MPSPSVAHLTDADLVCALPQLAGRERDATVALIVHLAEFDARRLYAGLGFSSTFRYCMEALRLSEDAAFNRIEAARTARRFPVVLEMLATGALSPTTLRMLARLLTPENHEALLRAAAGKTKQQVDRLIVSLQPRPDVPTTIRPLSVPRSRATPPPVAIPAPAAAPAAAPPMADTPSLSLPPTPPRAIVRPLAPERYEIRFTASAETREKLREAQDLLGHAVPSGDLDQVFNRALTRLVEDLRKRKYGETNRRRAAPDDLDIQASADKESHDRPAGHTRYVSPEVRRGVNGRDDDQCAFVAAGGRRCDETRFIELHHVHPYGAGGTATVENIELRCHAHNAHEARIFYDPLREYVPPA